MATNKTTKRDFFTAISNYFADAPANMDATLPDFADGFEDFAEQVMAFCKHENDLLTKKHSKSGATKSQKLNEGVKVEILATLDPTEGKRSTEIAAEVGISVQKCTALLKQMVDAGTVVRSVDKKVVTFTTAE